MIPLKVLLLIAYIGNFKAQVQKYPRETGFLILQLPFSRICREIVHSVSVVNVQTVSDVAPVEHISSNAVKILQIEAENYILKYLACKYYISMDEDIKH